MATVLITGGLGYLGGRIAIELANAGYAVIATSRQANQAAPSWLPQLRIVSPNWESMSDLDEICSGIDCIVHLAAMNEVDAAKDPVGALRTNGLASLMLLRAAESAGVRRFIYFSTAHVYGSPLEGTLTEATLPRPRHPYAITHRVTEDFVLAAHASHKLDGIVVRLSNGFGAPMSADVNRWSLLVNDLCRQAATTGRLALHSSGLQLRDFVTLEDVGRGVLHLLGLPRDALADGLFNLGDRTASVLDMTERVVRRVYVLTGQTIPIDRPSAGNETIAGLDFVCDKLNATGFVPLSHFDEEVTATLKLCWAAFGRGKEHD